MQNTLSQITIHGFKSLNDLNSFQLRNINILIGANGSGKSNFIEFFKLLRAAMGHGIPGFGKSLNSYISICGGINDFFHNGPDNTPEIEVGLVSRNQNKADFCLKSSGREQAVVHDIEGQLLTETALKDMLSSLFGEQAENQNKNQARIAPYHFHDTRMRSAMRTSAIIQDNEYLRLDASNIAPFLLRLKNEYPDSYEDIVETVQTVAPFFENFLLRINHQGEKQTVNLEWNQKDSDYPMQPYHLSDGSLRFICLATALLQPDPPAIIVIDEPELGLHPFALSIFTEMLKSAAKKSQIIVATQSALLIDDFTPEDIITVSRVDGASVFERLHSDRLGVWLEEYTLGQLWQKNVIAGSPDYA